MDTVLSVSLNNEFGLNQQLQPDDLVELYDLQGSMNTVFMILLFALQIAFLRINLAVRVTKL